MKRCMTVIMIICLILSFGGCAKKSGITSDNLKKDAGILKTEYGYDTVLLKNDDVDNELYYTYGVETADHIVDYLICMPQEDSPCTVLCLIVDDPSCLDELQDQIDSYHVKGQYSKYQLYDPDGFDILRNATFKQYSNALVLVIDENDRIDSIFAIFDGNF